MKIPYQSHIEEKVGIEWPLLWEIYGHQIPIVFPCNVRIPYQFHIEETAGKGAITMGSLWASHSHRFPIKWIA